MGKDGEVAKLTRAYGSLAENSLFNYLFFNSLTRRGLVAVNIKNERVERLLDTVAAMTGETKTEAIRRALEERRDRLERGADDLNPADRLRRLLEREIWPTIPAEVRGTRLTKEEEEALLGFGPLGA